MNKVKLVLILFLFITNIHTAFAIEDGQIKKGDILSLQDCVAIAINNSPIIKKYEYNLQIANSDLGIAKSAYFPTLGAEAGIYQDYNSNKNYDGSSNRNLPAVNVYLSQLIWNFGKTSALIKMEHFYKLAAEYQFMDSICNTIYSVKTQYFNVLRAKAILEIEKNNVLINERNLARAKNFYETGKKSKIDYVNAQVFLSEAKMRLIDAQTDYNIAMADLGNALYIAYTPDFEIKKVDTFSFDDIYTPSYLTKNTFYSSHNEQEKIVNIAYETRIEKNEVSKIKDLPFTMEESFGLAYKNSPDLWVLESTLDAMKESVNYIKRQYYPDIVGNVGYGFDNARDASNNRINMSVNMVSAVNVKQQIHEVERANAQVNLAENDIYQFKQNLYFEVKKCFLNVDKSAAQIRASQVKVHEALENFELANKQYEEGKLDYIALQEARKEYNEAKTLHVRMIYEYNIALAELEIAMHYHLDDLHSQAQHALHYHYKDIINKLEASLHCEHRHEEELKDKNKK